MNEVAIAAVGITFFLFAFRLYEHFEKEVEKAIQRLENMKKWDQKPEGFEDVEKAQKRLIFWYHGKWKRFLWVWLPNLLFVLLLILLIINEPVILKLWTFFYLVILLIPVIGILLGMSGRPTEKYEEMLLRVRGIEHEHAYLRKRWRIFKKSLGCGSVELRETSRDLSNKSLIFAGFTLTILIFVAGFYRENLMQVSAVITFFLFGFLLFLISAEVTRNVAFGWEYFIGEILYLSATAFVAGVLIMFFRPVLEGFVQNLSIILMMVYIGFLIVYILNSVYSLMRES